MQSEFGTKASPIHNMVFPHLLDFHFDFAKKKHFLGKDKKTTGFLVNKTEYLAQILTSKRNKLIFW